MNHKNIIRFLDDLEKEKPYFYNLLFNNSISDINIGEMTYQCKHLFKKYNMKEYCFDGFGGGNIHLAKKEKVFIELRITNKNNSYLNNNTYIKNNKYVIFIEDLMKYKHIFDFSIIEMTEEELFYIELKELFGNKKG